MKFRKTKRVFAMFLSCTLLLLLAACGGNAGSGSGTAAEPPPADAGADTDSAAAIEPYTFRITCGSSPSSSMVAVMTLLCELLETNSDGAFTTDFLNDNAYVEKQALDELMTNIIDIVYLGSGAASTTVSEVAYLGMPGCFRFTENAALFLDFEAKLRDELAAVYENYDIHYLGLRVPAKMAVVGTGEAVTSPAQLKGKIVRVAGTWMGKLAVSLDLATATVPVSELATALQRKTVDSCITGIEQVRSTMLGEVVDYCSILAEVDSVGALVMNGATWDALTDAQRACVDSTVEEWMQACLDISEQFYDDAVQSVIDANVEPYILTDEECAAFLATIDTVYAEIDQTVGPEGIALKEAMLAWRAENL
ncbi:MAG: TRAP transporter substrate-binding protein DctP [Clostridiales Family XIII bacterium]|jgi:C4-dicarboxylate-binding protein DctP|nr:TRAP transporter substrate-binding protein DctP [Clostridiales Family XIII bacterium]